MAEKPYKFYDRRGQSWGGGSNRMVPTATPSYERKQVPNLQFDFHRKISATGLARARDNSEYLFWKYPIIQGALLEQADLSMSHFAPQFAGQNQAWGDKVTGLLLDFADMFDVRGWPFDEASYLHNLVLHAHMDGTYWTLLTESSNGFPMVQVIPPHRIGGLVDETTVAANDAFETPTFGGEKYSGTANPWAGSRVIAGCIVNEFGAAQAYRLYDDPPVSFRDISAASLFPAFFPIYPDQLVGIPSLAASGPDVQDVGETRDFEKLAQKGAARIGLIETNEGGAPPPGLEILAPGAEGSMNSSDSPMYSQVLEGGIYQYLKSNTGSKLETLVANRPTENQQKYEDKLLAGCFYSIGWSLYFSLLPGVGGAEKRVIVDRCNRQVWKNQRLAAKAMRRVVGYRVAKFAKLGMIELDPEWYKWEFQGPADSTADRKYDSELDLRENERGWLTDEDAIERRGGSYRVVKLKKYRETERRWEEARQLSEQFKITIQEAYFSLCQPTPNAPAGTAPPKQLSNGEPEE